VSAGFGATANRLGALALRLSDRMQLAMTADGVRSLSAATALSVLDRWFGAPPSVDALRRVLGLTPSGGVRLVDVLERDGLVTRRPGTDARVRTVTLTAKGRRTARTAVTARHELLEEVLAPLDPAERAALATIVDKVLTGLVLAPPRPDAAMCRLCDTEACGAQRDQPCPITLAALRQRSAGTSIP
jgi:DNA-binding MarR family transcriptional regulator